MSEAEIRYVVPQAARDLGDLETILNAMGTFESTTPFPFDHQYDARASEDADGKATVALVRTTPYDACESSLLARADEVREEVESYFPKADKTRLMSHFASIATKKAIKSL